MRQILRAINKRAACELPTAYKRLRLIDFKRWVMPPMTGTARLQRGTRLSLVEVSI
jgi:hypothetical protein